jgi:hypothetical protein
MGNEKPDRFVGLPLTERGGLSLNPKEHPDLKLSHILTYAAVRSFIGTHPANERYSRWTVSIPAIAERAGLHRSTVIEALDWLEAESYLVSEKNGRTATRYTIILRRPQFLGTCRREGRAEAIDDYEAWLASRSEETRAELAEERRERCSQDEKSRLARATAPKSPGDDRNSFGAVENSAEVVAGRLREVAGRRPVADGRPVTRSRSESEITKSKELLPSGSTPPEALPSLQKPWGRTQEEIATMQDAIRLGLATLKGQKPRTKDGG